MIIGQTKLLEKIDILSKRFPRFVILCGDKGSGKKTICEYISKKLQMPLVTCGIKVEDVRNTIDMAYEQFSPIMYMLPDVDTMSPAGKNSLLKVTEEPPKSAYFILTVCSDSAILDTLKSRGTFLHLDTYTPLELLAYCRLKHYDYTDSEYNIITSICNTTGEVDILHNNKVMELYEYGKKLALNIHIPKSGNIFKSVKAIQSKEGESGFDPILTFRVVRNIYFDKGMETHKPQYFEAVKVTSKCIQELSLVGVSKLGTMDKWIMDVRAALRGI